MKIRILSDLHLEFHKDKGKCFIDSLDPTGDVLVLAGDITVGKSITKIISRFADKFAKVVYVHGNHEYYDGSTSDVIKATEKAVADNDNVTWLNNDVVTIDGIRFVGTPMWFPRTETAVSMKRWLNDFSLIENCDPWAFDENEKAVEFLNKEVQKGDVVITHHVPSYESIHSKYMGQPTNCFFLCDMEELIYERCPTLWIHGHTHCSFDYQMDHSSTKVVCNPFGYLRHEENRKFVEDKIVEIKASVA